MRIRIPFDLVSLQEDGFHCLVEGAVNGNPLLIVLDTGASRSCFDIAFLQQFVGEHSLQANDSMTSGIGTNTLSSFVTTVDEFSMGSFVIKGYQAIGLDLAHIHEAYNQVGLPLVNGILGADILARHHAIIDYRKREITLNSRPSRKKI